MRLLSLGRISLLLLALFVVTMSTTTASATIQTVNQSGLSFTPANLTVAVGDTVQWIWSTGSHTVTNGTSAVDPQVGTLFDESFTSANPLVTYVFTEVGSVPYFCRPHLGLGMTGTITVEAASAVDDVPAGALSVLLQNVPNPFNPRTQIRFDLPAAADVQLTVHDLSGRLVRTLLAGAALPVGAHALVWNGRDDLDTPVAAGVYFYSLRTDTVFETRRMTLIK